MLTETGLSIDCMTFLALAYFPFCFLILTPSRSELIFSFLFLSVLPIEFLFLNIFISISYCAFSFFNICTVGLFLEEFIFIMFSRKALGIYAYLPKFYDILYLINNSSILLFDGNPYFNTLILYQLLPFSCC